MSIESTLYDTLRNNAGVAALVSTRIYPLVAPDNAAVPFIVYQLITGMAHNQLVGAPGSERKVLQVSCVANSYTAAKAIAVACKASINVSVGYLMSERDDFFDQAEFYRIMLDFSLIG